MDLEQIGYFLYMEEQERRQQEEEEASMKRRRPYFTGDGLEEKTTQNNDKD